MMDSGLHYGLAAWIGGLRPTDDFVSCPPIPTAIDLVDLENMQNTADLARAAEFARMTNFVPREAGAIDTTTNLWRTHRDLLAEMEFASQPWAKADQEAYETAFNFLYGENELGFREPSDQLVLNNEWKRAYHDLRESGAPATDQQLTMVNWVSIGFKAEVENALNTVTRLALQSSLRKAVDERTALEEPDGPALFHQSNQYFAPVFFSPISAVAQETWLKAEVDFSDLDKAAGKTAYNSHWRGYRAGKRANVSFRYSVLDCSRPWFSPQLYQADDWRFSTAQKSVAAGDGLAGELPAYVHSVYLVTISKKTVPAPTRPAKPPATVGNRRRASLGRRVKLNLQSVAKPGALRPQILRIKPAAKSLGSAPRPNPVSNIRAAGPVARIQPVLKLDTTMVFARPVLGGKLHLLTQAAQQVRLSMATDFLRNRGNSGSPASSTPPAADTPTYIVGFGCRRLPKSPDPNPNYEW